MSTISKSMPGMSTDFVTDLAANAKADQASLGRLDPSSRMKAPDRGEIRKISEDFESLFLGIVLKSMRQTVQKSGLMDGGNAEDIYRSMLDDEYAKMMAGQRHTGIADNIEEFLLRSYGETKAPEEAIGRAIGMKTYQQQGLQNLEKQARIDTSGIPSSPVANAPGESSMLRQSSIPKPL